MQIEKANTYTPNFQAGLNHKILIKELLTNPKSKEKVLSELYNIDADFNNNKSMALANKYCADIFRTLLKKTDMDFRYPPNIKVYRQEQLLNKNSAENFCISDTKSVLKNDYPYPGRSIFFSEYPSLEYINYRSERLHHDKQSSSPHFLAPFIHEWIHSLQLDYIYNKFGYGGKCEYMTQQYPNKIQTKSGFDIVEKLSGQHLSEKENEIVYDELGEYATKPENQYFEVFSEAVTKFICNSLSGVKIIKNPTDLFKQTSKDFQNIIKKVLNFENV